MAEAPSFWEGWGERLAALRNVPPVLRIVWQSGPLVVFLGLVLRLVTSLVPLAALWITKLIIDNIVHIVTNHQPVQPVLWRLVGAEFSGTIVGSLRSRSIQDLES